MADGISTANPATKLRTRMTLFLTRCFCLHLQYTLSINKIDYIKTLNAF